MTLQRRYPKLTLLPVVISVLFLFFGWIQLQAQETIGPCVGFTPQLQVGGQGAVLPGLTNSVRAQPAIDGTEVGQIDASTTFSVLDGPTCVDGFTWWYVQAGSLEGWTPAGNIASRFLIAIGNPVQPGNTGGNPAQPGNTDGGQGQEGQANVAFILDASGSMQAQLPNGERRITAAQDALRQLSTQLPANVNASLWTFGHRVGNSEAERPQSCQDIEQLVPLGPANAQQFQSAASSVTARGWTPLTSTIEQAANTLPPASDNSIIVISDGEETCDGDPCAVAEALHNSNIELVVNTIGFDVDATTREQLQCIARVTNGQYFDAADADELSVALQEASAPPTPSSPPPTATPTEAPGGAYVAVDSNGNVLNQVTIEVENVATLDDFTGNGRATVPAGEYRGRVRVPLADGVTQSINLQDTGLTQVGPAEELFINVDNYFGEPVTFQVANGAGNLLPNAQISLSGQYCIGDPFATFTGEAMRFRTTGGSQRLCLTVTTNGEIFRPHTVNNLDINALTQDVQTLTVYDGLTFRTAGAQPPGIGRVQAVAPSGEPYPTGRNPFIIPTNLNDIIWWRSPDTTANTFFYTVPGEVDVSLGGTARSYLMTVSITGGQVTPVAIAQDANGNYVAPETSEAQSENDTTQPADVIFFDDFEAADVSDLQRTYSAWENWDVVAGTVDAINATRARNVDDNYGVMVDLDGSNRSSGVITTKETFSLQPSDYTFSFEASSSRGGDGDNTFRAVVDGFVDETITVSTEQPMQLYTYTFTVTAPAEVQITFDHTLTPGDNEGAFIDNVSLARGIPVDGSGLGDAGGTIVFESTFETGDESWTVVNGGTGPTQQLIDRERAICSTDTGNGVYAFQAPPGWQRDWSPLYGGTLVYEIRSDPDDTAYEDVDVYLLGENAMITYDHPTNPSATNFERIEVPLTPQAGWTFNGQPLDEDGLRDFLSNTPRLRIRADYRNAVGEETTCLARVTLLLPADADTAGPNDGTHG